MKRKSLKDSDCPACRSLDVIGDWWSLLIVAEAQFGMRRFSEFQRKLNIPRNTLTARLRKLVADDILEIQPATDGGAFREYGLTAKGRGLFIVIAALRQWGADCFFNSDACLQLIDTRDHQPLQRLELRAHDGRPVGPEDLEFLPRS